ncbi:MAG: peptidoglycan DD-metalloendopeptidase family protein [Proteobacteria bacterium]|nr:peptidoglycan DD-metalloendopeptidase family protein [Pseudomonadota bacterium]
MRILRSGLAFLLRLGIAPFMPVNRLCARLFMDREVILRRNGRVKFFVLTRRAQLVAAGVLLLIGGWFVFTNVAAVYQRSVIAAKDGEIDAGERAFAALRDEVSRSVARIEDLDQNLKAKHAEIRGLFSQRIRLRKRLGSVKVKLGESEKDRKIARASRQATDRALGQLRVTLDGAVKRNIRLRGAVESLETRLQDSALDRSDLIEEQDRLEGRVKDLEQSLVDLQTSREQVLDRLTERTVNRIDEFKEVIAMTGLDADKLLGGVFDNTAGQGGPFIAFKPEADNKEDEFDSRLATLNGYMDRWDGLKGLLKTLPLTSPSDHYYVSSRFGKRRDPVNKKWGMHYGVDLAGLKKSPVLSTAAGTVVSVSRHPSYGRMIVIDHGLGIRTRYGHLYKILVRRGQKVGFRQKIGLMGNTGRTTGAHIHYEILVNGKPYDPLKFMQAGKYVFKG